MQKLKKNIILVHSCFSFIIFTIVLYYGCCKSINEILNLNDFFCLENKDIFLIMVLGFFILMGIIADLYFGPKAFIKYCLGLSAILMFFFLGLLLEALNSHNNILLATSFAKKLELSGVNLDPERY